MLEPTFVENFEDIQKVAEEMKGYARKAPVAKEVEYSKNEEEATENARRPEVVEYCKQSPGIRLLIFQKVLPITLGFSLDQYKDPARWTLSMSVPHPRDENGTPVIGRVPDKLATFIATAFFGEEYKEVPPEGAYKTIRQFEKVI